MAQSYWAFTTAELMTHSCKVCKWHATGKHVGTSEAKGQQLHVSSSNESAHVTAAKEAARPGCGSFGGGNDLSGSQTHWIQYPFLAQTYPLFLFGLNLIRYGVGWRKPIGN